MSRDTCTDVITWWIVTLRTRFTVIKKTLAKKDRSGWQSTSLTTLTQAQMAQIDTDAKLTLAATDSNDMTDLSSGIWD